MKTNVRWKGWVLGASMGLALLAGGPVQALDRGDPVPPYRLSLEGGGSATNGSEQGRVTLIHFWAVWCVPCREEMPRLEKLYQAYHAQGLDIYAIDMDGDQDVAQAEAMMKHYTFPWGRKKSADIEGFGRIWRLPMSILIDRHGVIRQNAWAADDDHGLDEATLNAAILPLLGPKVAAPAVSAVGGTIVVSEARSRATAPGQEVGVVYLTLKNPGSEEDALEGADSPLAGHIMLHDTTMEMGGMSHMHHEYHLVIPAHGEVSLSPGGHHLMLEDLQKPLVAGQTLPLDLHFKHAPVQHLEVLIQPLVP